MTTTIQVSRGLCSPMRDDVLTALKPFGVRILEFDCWGEGHHYLPVPDGARVQDGGEIGKWAKKHIAHVTVSDAQAAWAERLLWQSGKVWLDRVWRTDNPTVSIGPLNRNLEWSAPADCKAGAHGTLGRGTMPTPWSTQRRQPRKRTRRTRGQERQDGGLLGRLKGWLR